MPNDTPTTLGLNDLFTSPPFVRQLHHAGFITYETGHEAGFEVYQTRRGFRTSRVFEGMCTALMFGFDDVDFICDDDGDEGVDRFLYSVYLKQLPRGASPFYSLHFHTSADGPIVSSTDDLHAFLDDDSKELFGIAQIRIDRTIEVLTLQYRRKDGVYRKGLAAMLGEIREESSSSSAVAIALESSGIYTATVLRYEFVPSRSNNGHGAYKPAFEQEALQRFDRRDAVVNKHGLPYAQNR